jgi:hypothetical protein
VPSAREAYSVSRRSQYAAEPSHWRKKGVWRGASTNGKRAVGAALPGCSIDLPSPEVAHGGALHTPPPHTARESLVILQIPDKKDPTASSSLFRQFLVIELKKT